MARLRERRGQVPDLAGERRRAMAAAACDTSKEAQLMHRYEMAHERSLRAAIRQLLELHRSGADLAEAEPEPEPEPAPAEPRLRNPFHLNEIHLRATPPLRPLGRGLGFGRRRPTSGRPRAPTRAPIGVPKPPPRPQGVPGPKGPRDPDREYQKRPARPACVRSAHAACPASAIGSGLGRAVRVSLPAAIRRADRGGVVAHRRGADHAESARDRPGGPPRRGDARPARGRITTR